VVSRRHFVPQLRGPRTRCQQVTAFPDINPSACKHFLVVSNVHIGTVAELRKGERDYALVQRMYEVGRKILEEEAPDAPKR